MEISHHLGARHLREARGLLLAASFAISALIMATLFVIPVAADTATAGPRTRQLGRERPQSKMRAPAAPSAGRQIARPRVKVPALGLDL